MPSLQTCSVKAVADLAPALVAVVALADAAVAQKLAADHALKDFDTVGDKKLLIDAFNAVRKTTYGELAALPHLHPEAMLPANFADRFFPHEAHTGVTSLTNPKDVEQAERARRVAMAQRVAGLGQEEALLLELARGSARRGVEPRGAGAAGATACHGLLSRCKRLNGARGGLGGRG